MGDGNAPLQQQNHRSETSSHVIRLRHDVRADGAPPPGGFYAFGGKILRSLKEENVDAVAARLFGINVASSHTAFLLAGQLTEVACSHTGKLSPQISAALKNESQVLVGDSGVS